MRLDKKNLPAALFSALGISLILAYNRGLLDKIGWSDLWPINWKAVLEIAVFLVIAVLAIEGLVRLSYRIFPERH